MRKTLAILLVGAGAIAGLAPHDARAQSETPAAANDARVHFERGVSLLNAQNFEGALAEFQRSYAISPRPSVLLNIGVALQSLHRYAEAARTMERYLHDVPNLPRQRRAEIQGGIDQMRALLARLRLDVQPSGATVRVDGIPIGAAPLAAPVEVGPGRHVVELEIDGQIVARQDLTIASGEDRTLQLVGSQRLGPANRATATDSASEAPVSAPAPSSLTVRGLPPGARAGVDGRTIDTTQPFVVSAGSHLVEISAAGYAPWHGSVTVGPSESRIVTAHLARERGGLRPIVFLSGVIATAVAGAGAAVTGVLTLTTRAEFVSLYRDDPQAAGVAARGAALRTATNALLIATGAFAIGTTIVLTQTRFGQTESTVGFSVAAASDTAIATATLRF